jgi:TRAP-type transport system small permease protein
MRRVLSILSRGLRWLEDGLLVSLLGAMIALAALQILQRNLFDTGFLWSDQALRLMVLWVALLGAIAASRDDHHIRIDLLSRYLSDLGKRVARIITDLFTLVVCSVVAWSAYQLVELEREFGSEVMGGAPAWVAQSILPIGFGLIALRYLVLLIQGLIGERPESAT